MAFYHNINPVLLQLGPLQIRWYGLMYVLSFLFVYWYVKKASRENKIKLTEEQIDNSMLLMTIALIIGARLFDVIFWDFSTFAQQPLKIFAIWEGGLSFHGGLTGILITSYLLCKKYKIKLLQFADVFAVPLALGQTFGRIGNFINGELYGGPTTLPWGINFHNELNQAGTAIFRHPTQIYEAIYNLIIFATLWKLKNKNLPPGTIFATFLIMYSIFRTLTEFIRVENTTIGPLTMSQALNIPMFIIGIWVMVKAVKARKYK